jgi:CO/xanthine dehydrogenase FAD-binding subunit
MAHVTSYFRPASLTAAIAALRDQRTMVIGGGTSLNGNPPEAPVAVVDLQALHLDGIEIADDGLLRLGASLTLARLARAEAAPPALREAARRERPSTLRTLSTLGGRIAAGEPDSELLAVLLAHDATVAIETVAGPEERTLGHLLADLPLPVAAIITAVTVQTTGTTACARTARSAADRPIVAAVARATGDGRLRLALSGVASTPVLVPPGRALDLDPPGDFRGSSAYRRALAGILSARVLQEVS